MNRATALAIAAAVDALALDDTLATLDPGEALAAVQAGTSAVLIGPPAVEYDTDYHATATWQLLAVPGLADRQTTWDRVDTLVAQLRQVLDVTDARPYDWSPDNGVPLVAVEVTATTDHDIP